jgi:hypothetical protein
MEKNYYNYADADTKNQRRTRRMLLLASLALVAIMAIIITLSIRSAHKLRVLSTNPTTETITTVSPYLKVTFNQKLSTKNVKLSSNPSIIKSYQIVNDVLVINLTSVESALDSSKEYTITVNTLSSDSGSRLSNQAFTFTPQDATPSNLPGDQQQALQREDQAAGNPATTDDIDFEGVESLFDQPISIAPILGLQHAFLQFKPYAQSVTVDNTSIHSVQQGSPTIEEFSLTIDNTSYRAKLTFTESIARLYLYDTGGKQVFDSKDIDLGQFPLE